MKTLKLKKPVTKSAWARHYGVTPGAVTQFVQEGKLPTNGEPGRACRVDLAFTLRMVRAGTPLGEAEETTEELKRRKIKVETQLAELQKETRVREIRAEAVAEFIEEMSTVFLRARGKLSKLADADKFFAVIDEVLDALSKNLPE